MRSNKEKGIWKNRELSENLLSKRHYYYLKEILLLFQWETSEINFYFNQSNFDLMIEMWDLNDKFQILYEMSAMAKSLCPLLFERVF